MEPTRFGPEMPLDAEVRKAGAQAPAFPARQLPPEKGQRLPCDERGN